MKQPTDLRVVLLAEVLPPRPGVLIVTMASGQWDALLAAAYDEGDVLLELDANERPLRAYQRSRP